MKRRTELFCYAMVLPATFLVLSLSVLPMLSTLRSAFFDHDLLAPEAYGVPFVGLANFQELVSEDPRFWRTLSNTITFVVIAVSVSICLGMVVALVLNREMRGRGFLRSAVLIPWVTPPVVAAGIWVWMYSGERSPINGLLMGLGLITTPIAFLSNWQVEWGPVNLPMLAVASVRVWGGLPFITIMLLAGLQSIPKELYEAAEIDGAGIRQRFRFVTLPLLMPVLQILLTLLVIGGFGVFDIHYIMTRGGPVDRTNVLAVLLYQNAFQFYRLGYAAAIGVIILTITGLIAAVYLRTSGRPE
jgi:ABC-type sugar transport system permease subunit